MTSPLIEPPRASASHECQTVIHHYNRRKLFAEKLHKNNFARIIKPCLQHRAMRKIIVDSSGAYIENPSIFLHRNLYSIYGADFAQLRKLASNNKTITSDKAPRELFFFRLSLRR